MTVFLFFAGVGVSVAGFLYLMWRLNRYLETRLEGIAAFVLEQDEL